MNSTACLRSLNYKLLALLATGLAALSGCKRDTSEQAAASANSEFEPNFVYARMIKVRFDVPTESFLKDTNRLTEQWFGTPDEPKLPPLFTEDEEYKDLLSLDKLKMAAGPAPEGTQVGETGLFRQQCASCHGMTGQGRGTVASSQNPYPRDFRRGIFKYKTTNRNAKPTKEDLRRTLVHGLDGTQMPKFNSLSSVQIDSLIDYIVYLSIRGELERQLVTLATDLDEGERIYQFELAESGNAEQKETLADQLEEAQDELIDVADSWIEAADEVEEPDEPDETIVAGFNDEAADAEELQASLKRGRELFLSSTAACSKCHGESAKGDGKQLPDYDDWTKEWTSSIQLDPQNHGALLPFLVDGALPPQPLAPRNLVEGRFRGGRDPNAIYQRIVYGIAGSPMPAAALKTSPDGLGLSNDNIWDLVNYVLSLKSEL